MELEGLRARLEAQKLSDKSVVPDLTLNGIEDFLGRDKIPQGMRESSAALKQFLAEKQSPTRPPDVGGEVQAQPPPGDAVWSTMLRSQGAYQKRYHAQEMSAKARETLDKLPWDEALQKGGAAFRVPWSPVPYRRGDPAMGGGQRQPHPSQRRSEWGLSQVHVRESRGGQAQALALPVSPLVVTLRVRQRRLNWGAFPTAGWPADIQMGVPGRVGGHGVGPGGDVLSPSQADVG